jgi:hypothetical protein
MQALNLFFDKNLKEGKGVCILTVEKVSDHYEFAIRSETGDKIEFVLTKTGLTAIDNRGRL